jgi:hypothetical protein
MIAGRFAELRELVERYGELTRTALGACHDLDEATFNAVLDARDLITARVGEVTREVGKLGPRQRGARPEIDRLMGTIKQALLTAQRLDDQLQAEAVAWRRSIGEELGRMSRTTRGGAAYGRPSGTGSPVLDLTR